MQPPFTHPSYAPAQRIADMLLAADNIVITAHANPDGDAAGSMVALGLALKKIGKRVALCNATGFPPSLAWLPWKGHVYKKIRTVSFRPTLVVALDCGDAERLGTNLEAEVLNYPTVNIDHHLANPCFASEDNWVEPLMASTGQMVAAIIACMNIPLHDDIAEAVYVTLCTDTGSFAFDNTTAEVFELATHLVREGLHVAAVRHKLDSQWSSARMRLWGKLAQSFTLHCKDRVACITVSLTDLAHFRTDKDDLEGFVEHLRHLRGVDVAALVREDTPQCCKISLRSTGTINVRDMAAHFKGGGHYNAAGATLHMPLTQATQATLDCITQHLGLCI